MVDYDRIGQTYSMTRRPDPRIQVAVSAALGAVDSVINVGAGAGSYEPVQTALAVEPSVTMIRQRTIGAAPAVRAVAESLPISDRVVDAALAVLTVHHWSDLERGVRELKRVARRRVVIFTWDEEVTRDFWLMREYLPAMAAAHAAHAVPLGRLLDALGDARIEPVPVPHDCTDGFAGAYWRRPGAYLRASVRAGISALACVDHADLAAGMAQLEADVASGAWERRHASLLDRAELDVGYRLVVKDL